VVIRFHLDEHIDPDIAEGLRRRSIDVTTTIEAGLEHATDEAQLAFAHTEQRVLVTRDRDFLVLNARAFLKLGLHFGTASADQSVVSSSA
jgi:predicted nuclease of predicted toxin-antitoxin system